MVHIPLCVHEPATSRLNTIKNSNYVRQAPDVDPGSLKPHAEGGPTSNGVEGDLVPKALTGCNGLAGSDQQDGGVPSEHLKKLTAFVV